jgi:hypothetical protein
VIFSLTTATPSGASPVPDDERPVAGILAGERRSRRREGGKSQEKTRDAPHLWTKYRPGS